MHETALGPCFIWRGREQQEGSRKQAFSPYLNSKKKTLKTLKEHMTNSLFCLQDTFNIRMLGRGPASLKFHYRYKI